MSQDMKSKGRPAARTRSCSGTSATPPVWGSLAQGLCRLVVTSPVILTRFYAALEADKEVSQYLIPVGGWSFWGDVCPHSGSGPLASTGGILGNPVKSVLQLLVPSSS